MSASPAPARVVTVLNLKGGVGKTHTTWLLASVCQERGQRVLLIDTDTQGNLTSSFLEQQSPVPGIEMLLHPGTDGAIQPLIRRTSFGHIDLIPSSPALAPFDLSDQKAWEKADLQRNFVGPVHSLKRQYQYILFDCPPRLSLVSFAALCASDAILIPMEAADWGAQGITQVTEAVEYVQKHFNERLRLLGYLVSRFKRARAIQRAYHRQLKTVFGELAFDAVLPDLAAFERAVTARVPITLHEPRCAAADFARQFFDEVERRLAGTDPGRASRSPSLSAKADALVRAA